MSVALLTAALLALGGPGHAHGHAASVRAPAVAVGSRVERDAEGRVRARYEVAQVGGEEVPHGRYESYWPNGKLRARGRMKRGEKWGSWTYFDAEGRKERTAVQVGGHEARATTWWPSGRLKSRSGPHRRQEWFADGKRKLDEPLGSRGLPHGLRRTWYPSGRKKRFEHFSHGLRHGLMRHYYPSGKLSLEGAWKVVGRSFGTRRSLKTGRWRAYFEGGQLRYEGRWVVIGGKEPRSVRDGTWRRYHRDGSLAGVEHYRRGERRDGAAPHAAPKTRAN